MAAGTFRIEWKIKQDGGKFWLFMRCAGPHWIPVDSFPSEDAAIKRAGAWSGSVRVSVTHADPPRPVPGSGIRPKKTPAPPPEMSVFAGIDIGAFINAEMAQLRN